MKNKKISDSQIVKVEHLTVDEILSIPKLKHLWDSLTGGSPLEAKLNEIRSYSKNFTLVYDHLGKETNIILRGVLTNDFTRSWENERKAYIVRGIKKDGSQEYCVMFKVQVSHRSQNPIIRTLYLIDAEINPYSGQILPLSTPIPAPILDIIRTGGKNVDKLEETYAPSCIVAEVQNSCFGTFMDKNVPKEIRDKKLPWTLNHTTGKYYLCSYIHSSAFYPTTTKWENVIIPLSDIYMIMNPRNEMIWDSIESDTKFGG